MKLKTDYYVEVENAIKSIFDLDIYSIEINGFIVTIKEPVAKKQLISLAKVCKKLPLHTSLKASNGKIIIEFW